VSAAALFLSPKTIEFHLRSVYRKLDINSRDELALAWPVDRTASATRPWASSSRELMSSLR